MIRNAHPNLPIEKENMNECKKHQMNWFIYSLSDFYPELVIEWALECIYNETQNNLERDLQIAQVPLAVLKFSFDHLCHFLLKQQFCAFFNDPSKGSVEARKASFLISLLYRPEQTHSDHVFDCP